MREYQREYARERRANDPEFRERLREVSREYLQTPEGRAIIYAQGAARRAQKLKATPRWLTPEDKQAIRELYEEAGRLSFETGVVYHVDHSVPLKAADRNGKRIACGLHVPWNLRLLPAAQNLSEGNRRDLAARDAEVYGELVERGLARPRVLLAAE